MMSYGYSVKEHDDPIVDIVEAAVNGFSECLEPGAFLVDMVPLRKSPFLSGPSRGILTVYSFPSHPSRLSSIFVSTNSAIRTRLVPWGRMESESQAVR